MENLYLICLIPPLTVIEDIDEIRNTISNKYNVIESLKRPVHITLYNPVKIVSKVLEERFFKALEDASYAENFDLVLNNFSSFEPHTVFIDIVHSKNLMNLQLGIKTVLKPLNLIQPKDQIKFNPHLTIAFRDVKPDTFFPIMEEYGAKKFQRRFNLNSFWVYKHINKRWQPYREFHFKNPNTKPQALTLF